MRFVPILLYHSISDDPPSETERFTVSPSDFARQLDLLVERGYGTLTISELVTAIESGQDVPNATVCVTFDDGFADFHETALNLLQERDFVATLYVTTTLMRESSNGRRPIGNSHPPMLDWSQLCDAAARGVEIGAHSRHHVQLDTLPRSQLHDEIAGSKTILEENLGRPIRTFAYPHGYSSPAVRAAVRAAGYRSACGMKNAICSARDDVFSLPRLMLERGTAPSQLDGWLRGAGAAISPRDETVRRKLWRLTRRGKVLFDKEKGRAYR